MTKLFSIILFCVFPLLVSAQANEQEAPKATDGEVAAEAPKTADGEAAAEEETVELSDEQKNYNFCIMQMALQSVSLVRVCAQQAIQEFLQEHGQEALQAASITDVGAACFHTGAGIIENLSERCKKAIEEEAASDAAAGKAAPAE